MIYSRFPGENLKICCYQGTFLFFKNFFFETSRGSKLRRDAPSSPPARNANQFLSGNIEGFWNIWSTCQRLTSCTHPMVHGWCFSHLQHTDLNSMYGVLNTEYVTMSEQTSRRKYFLHHRNHNTIIIKFKLSLSRIQQMKREEKIPLPSSAG